MIVDIDAGQEFILQPCMNARKITIRMLTEDSVRLDIEEVVPTVPCTTREEAP